jgi:NADH-ubiquinone oxidoreductase chain 2
MLIYSTLLLLTSNAMNNRRDSSIIYSRISVIILINTILLLYLILSINFSYKGLILYNGYIEIKNYTLFFIVFILIISAIIISINSVYPRIIFIKNTTLKNKYLQNLTNIVNKMSDQYRIIEYPLILLFCIIGVIFLVLSTDLISVFLSIELQSYSLYLISSIYRNSEASITAGLTYFLLGGLSSCIILLGISIIYVNYGNTNIENIYVINNIFNSLKNSAYNTESYMDNINMVYLYIFMYTQYLYVQIGLAIISIGLLFKISAAPFHFWSPDVYDAIPTIVTTFVAIVPKISILILLYNISFYTYNDNWVELSWSNTLIISSILSFIVGSIVGLVQYRIKRLFAYSTISHLGFMLLGLSINNLESIRALFFYIIQYTISNLNTFLILIVMGNSLYTFISNNKYSIKEKEYSPIQLLSQLKGFFFINPILSISLSLTFFSFVGIPPLIGFFGKQMILTAAIDKGYILTVIIAIITSVISAVYYLILIKNIYFEKSEYKVNNKIIQNINKHVEVNNYIKHDNIILSSCLPLIISILTLIIMFFILFNYEIIKLIYMIT